MGKEKKYFPIETETACQLKWAWSTVSLNEGKTYSCYRSSTSDVDSNNFRDFHNTPKKIEARKKMLDGEWPGDGCEYCRDIEAVGGFSDRQRYLTIPDISPIELEENLLLTKVSPAIVEVYFNNQCNMGCLYCIPELSSMITKENEKTGDFIKGGVKLVNKTEWKAKSFTSNYKTLVPEFWKWFSDGFPKVKRFHILGGEPFLQKELDQLIEKIDKTPNKNCEFNIITNLSLPTHRIKEIIEKLKSLLTKRKLKRIDITVSIDCWGPQQEYVRWGLDLDLFEKNMLYLLEQKWLKINIQQTISILTIKTMPKLLEKLKEWRNKHSIDHHLGTVNPYPHYLDPYQMFGGEEFDEDATIILENFDRSNKDNELAYKTMHGIFKRIKQSKYNEKNISDLFIFLDEKDRRRGTNWKKLFPWLEKYVV